MINFKSIEDRNNVNKIKKENENNKINNDIYYDDIFTCSLCGLKKPYHEDLFETGIFTICNDCNLEEVCIDCDDNISFVEMNYMIENNIKIEKCMYCLSKNDNELENIFLEYIKKNVNKEFIDYYVKEINLKKNNNYKNKYEDLIKDVNIFLSFINCKNLDEAKEKFLVLKNNNK